MSCKLAPLNSTMGSPLHPRPPWMSTLQTSKPFKSAIPKAPRFNILIRLSSSSNAFSADDTSSPDCKQNQDDLKDDRVSLAFNRALEYKKSLRSNDVEKTGEFQAENLSRIEVRAGGIRDSMSGKVEFASDNEEVEQKAVSESAGSVVEKATEFEKSKGIGDEDGKDELPDAVRVAMEKAKEYKKNKGTISSIKSSIVDDKSPGDENGNLDVSDAFTISMEKAREYEMNKGTLSSEGNEKVSGSSSGSKNERTNEIPKDNFGGKKELKVSKIDFLGLDFSDKKQRRGLPPGLVPAPDPFQGKELPEVEFLVGDDSKFGNGPSSELETTQENASDMYKPKVSTWGVFPRPNNISKAFGGGRNIRPGETLETEEVKAAKEARTKQLLAAYKAQIGLNVNPKLKAECEKALKDGDELMDVGKLKDALPYYQLVMDKMPFQTELHGLAALQWAICQDSLSRSDQAQATYKKLKSHPNALVNKKATQFAFSFEAMEMMKVRRSAPRNPGFQTYFDAFVEDKPKYNTSQDSEPEEGALAETLPYILVLILPVFIFLLIAAKKGT